MKTLTLTDAEYAIVKEAVACRNDMVNDLMFENVVAINLYPSVDKPTVLTSENAKVFREEMDKVIRQQVEHIRLLDKLGITVNKAGYTV